MAALIGHTHTIMQCVACLRTNLELLARAPFPQVKMFCHYAPHELEEIEAAALALDNMLAKVKEAKT